VLGLTLHSALRLATLGAVAGWGAGFALVQLLARPLVALLFEVEVLDPLAFGVVPLLLIGVALAAALGPALRSTRVDPVVALEAQ
jgi:ABC-type antimicrobial peptide transport system permease subunit